jgi:hypothetical protein
MPMSGMELPNIRFKGPTLERWGNFNVTTVPDGVVVGSVFEFISVNLERSY